MRDILNIEHPIVVEKPSLPSSKIQMQTLVQEYTNTDSITRSTNISTL